VDTRAKGRAPLPLTYPPVASFLAAFVARNKSARTLPSVLAQLRRGAVRRELPWLSFLDARRIAELVGYLRLHDTSASRQKAAFRTSHLIDGCALINLAEPVHLLEASQLATGHDGLLRGGELTGELRAHQVTWWPRHSGFSLRLHRDKTHRDGNGVLISYTDNASPVSAVKLLRRWWRLRRLQGDDFIFPAIVRGRIVPDRAGSIEQLRKLIKRMASTLGLDPLLYSAHSLRAGGATDLFAAQVPYPTIKRMGRWTSDAAMMYYRADDDLWSAVGEGFSAMARRHGL
jgi:hypothetical protein